MKRKDDSETQIDHFQCRTNRMFEDNGDWFFRTREGTVEGPYMDEWEAKTWVDLYVSYIDSTAPPSEHRLTLEPTKLENAG